MRLKREIAEFFAEYVRINFNDAEIYLFGSRTDDNQKGGDIDILLLSKEKLEFRDISRMRTRFYMAFGEQKLDIVNFTFSEESPFKEIALEHAVRL